MFNRHASVVNPVLESPEFRADTKRMIADYVVGDGRMIGGSFSEPSTTSLIGGRPLAIRARRVDGDWRITGRKIFASMLEAADHVMVLAYPEAARMGSSRALESAEMLPPMNLA